jgi:hypothetical protein
MVLPRDPDSVGRRLRRRGRLIGLRQAASSRSEWTRGRLYAPVGADNRRSRPMVRCEAGHVGRGPLRGMRDHRGCKRLDHSRKGDRGPNRRGCCRGRGLREHRLWLRRRRFLRQRLRRERRRLGRRSRGRGRRLDLPRRRGRRPRRQEEQRIEITLRIVGLADAEIDVRLGQLDIAARPDRSNGIAFSDLDALLDPVGAEMNERDRVAVLRLNRHGLATFRHRPGEGHDPSRGSAHGRSRRRADVDPPVLARRVRVVAVEGEPAQDRPVDGPSPGKTRGRERQSGDQRS